MSDFLRLFLIFVCAVNPPAVVLALRRTREGGAVDRRNFAAGIAVALATFGGIIAGADSILDALDLAPESFRIAAGIIMLTPGLFAVWRGRVAAASLEGRLGDALFPIAVPLIAGPASLAASLSYGADYNFAQVFAAAAIAALLGGALGATIRGRTAALDGVARVLGALLCAFAIGLIVEGVRDI
jgi:small neutral amino acid transporter SnatA (MarC family)